MENTNYATMNEHILNNLYDFNKNNPVSNLLVSNGEINLYKLLKGIYRNNFEIMVKVRVIDVIKNKYLLNKEHIDFAIKSHFDFLVCDLNLNPIVAIEFDGYHDDNQVNRDKIKDEICNTLGLPIIRIKNDEPITTYTIASKLIMCIHDYDFSKLIQQATSYLHDNKYNKKLS